MKKTSLFFFSITISLLLSSFSFPNENEDAKQILEAALKNHYLQEILEKNDHGDYLPIYLLTNSVISEKLELNLSKLDVNLTNSLKKEDISDNSNFLSLYDIRIDKGKSMLKMYLGKDKKKGKFIKMKFKKYPSGWEFYSIYAKGNGGLTYIIE